MDENVSQCYIHFGEILVTVVMLCLMNWPARFRSREVSFNTTGMWFQGIKRSLKKKKHWDVLDIPVVLFYLESSEGGVAHYK